jgi:UDP-N-acetylmuramoyl-L-alanyl-D-glutamate--2,6-diaminopimelate ligase
MQGCPNAEEIQDRKDAIQKGIEQLETGDFLLIAGKGHEAHQIIGNQIKDFDDRAIARQLIKNLNSEIN